MLACPPYSAIAMIRTCKYLNNRFNNEIFWKQYSAPIRSRHCLPGEDQDRIKENTFFDYVSSRALPLS